MNDERRRCIFPSIISTISTFLIEKHFSTFCYGIDEQINIFVSFSSNLSQSRNHSFCDLIVWWIRHICTVNGSGNIRRTFYTINRNVNNSNGYNEWHEIGYYSKSDIFITICSVPYGMSNSINGFIFLKAIRF